MKTSMVRFALSAAMVSLFLISIPLLASETDDSIESYAKRTYIFKTYLKSDDIKIRSEAGVITLTGTVSEEDHKSLAGETVASFPGIKRVDNRLEVKGEIPAEDADVWLINKVKLTLFFHRNLNASGTEIFAKEGIVTLRGEATSKAQKDLTTEYAKDVEGVRDVKNEMTVAMPSGEKAVAVIESIDDASVTALVRTTLRYHRSTSALHITAETKDGVVTLGGKVKSSTEKDLAGKLVDDVHGVKRVVNRMTVD